MLNTIKQNYYIKTYAESNVTLKFANISLFMKGYFTILGLNVLLYRAELPEFELTIARLDKKIDAGFVIITNSTYSYLNVTRFNIIMSDIYTDGITRYQFMLMELNSCNLRIQRSTFYRITQHFYAMIEAYNCKVELADVNFIESAGILIHNESTIHMHNVSINNAPIRLTTNSSLYIDHSHYEGTRGLVLEENCNMNMTNTFVEYQGNYVFLNAYHNVHANIENCIFRNITALLTAKHSYISIDNSKISDIQSNTEIYHFIDISVGSYLIINDTKILHNQPSKIKAFFGGTLKSYLEMYRCLYAWNTFPIHFVAEYNSDVVFKETSFKNNNSTTGILFAKENKCIIHSCLFKSNKRINIVKVQSSNVTIINCSFLNNFESTREIVSMESDNVELNNYLDIENCTFNESSDYLVWVKKVAEISIQNSHFQCLTQYDYFIIIISEARSMRIARSRFFILYWNILSIKGPHQDTIVYTFQSRFELMRSTITNKTDLMCMEGGLDMFLEHGEIKYEETPFVSSKCLRIFKIKIWQLNLADQVDQVDLTDQIELAG